MNVYMFFLLMLLASHTIAYKLLDEQFHDSNVFTQGFEINDNKFYMSSGGYNKRESFIQVENYEGSLIEKLLLGKCKNKNSDAYGGNIFAEGLTLLDGKLYLLTWKCKEIHVYDASQHKLKFIEKLTYPKGIKEGWGIANNGKDLILSDGSRKLYTLNKDNLLIKNVIRTKYNKLNELEYIDGYVYANVWGKSYILKIKYDEKSRTKRIRLTNISKNHRKGRDGQFVLNGIAYDEKRDAIWVTGKFWNNKYLIRE